MKKRLSVFQGNLGGFVNVKQWRTPLLLLGVVLIASGCPLLIIDGFDLFSSADFFSGDNDFRAFPAGAEDGMGGEGEGEGDGGGAVREVVEPDVIRRVGELLYILNQHRGLTIVDLATETMLAQVPTNGLPRDLYLVGDRAYVLVGYANTLSIDGDEVSQEVSSRLYIVDVADPTRAEIISDFDLNGDLIDSRLVGDVLYAVSAEYAYNWYGPEVFKQQTSESWVTSIDVSDPDNIAIVDELDFPGFGSVIYATSEAIFVSNHDWEIDDSIITMIDISDPAGIIVLRDTYRVPGQVADRFKMDVYDGILRVVSSTSWPEREVHVTMIDLADPDDLYRIGHTTIEGAEGETLFATRFDGPRGYVVTFLRIDPLFVLDLSDPANPTVSGVLEVPGWSTHIEPQGDRLVALGIDDTDGWKVSVSLFDVADPQNPALLARESFGQGWAWSEAFNDVKALTVLEDTIIVPFTGWNGVGGGFDRIQFLSYTSDTLFLEGHVDLEGTIVRSFEYDGYFYGVTTEQLATIDGADLMAPQVVNELTLAEYVGDFHEVSSELGLEVISKFDQQATILRTTTLDGARLGEIEIDTDNLQSTHIAGDTAILVSTGWDGFSFYTVSLVDISDPSSPVLTTQTQVDVQPHWGGYFGGPIFFDGLADIDVAIAPGPMTNGDGAFVLGNTLALRCYSEDFNIAFGDGPTGAGGEGEGEGEPRDPDNPDGTEPGADGETGTTKGDYGYGFYNNDLPCLALVDLETGIWTQTIGLDFGDILSLNAIGDKLYISTKEVLGFDVLFRPTVTHYVREMDVSVPAVGPAANVPGRFVQYDPTSNILVLEDAQYVLPFGFERSLESVSWSGLSTVVPVDSLTLPRGTNGVMGRGSRIFTQGYREGYHIGSVALDETGHLTLDGEVRVSGAWAYLLDAHEDSAYAAVGGAAIARYDFSGTPSLADVIETMGAPVTLRFGETTAYAPLGYAGVARIPL